jgi:hypothetical protein
MGFGPTVVPTTDDLPAYGELLTLSVQEIWEDPTEGRLQWAELLARRRARGARLARLGTARDRTPGANEMALHLQYDLALLRLCARMGIDADVARFAQPIEERRRLELALVSAGLDLDETAGTLVSDHVE